MAGLRLGEPPRVQRLRPQPRPPGPLRRAPGIGWRSSVTDGRRPVYYVTLYSQDLPAGQRPVAFELVVPVYRDELGPDASVAERRRQFLGWATGQFRAGDLLDGAMQNVAPTTGVELHDLEAGSDSRVASHPRGFRAGGRYVRENTFTFGERAFKLRYAPLPGNAILTERTIGASVVLGTGMAVAILLAALLWLLAQVGALYREVDRLARTDSLTGVANRRAWDQELPRELARASRSGRPLCLALLDLDHFKDYNDQHGHQAGDRLLKAAAPPSPRAPARSGWPPGTAARAPTS